MAPESSQEKTFTYQSPNLDIPNPPGDLSYAGFEDYRNREILKANGISLSEDELIAALDNTTNVLQAAVAHAIGSLRIRAAIPKLKQLLASTEDLVKVEAAYALARLGESEGKEALRECLGYPLDAYLFPPIAAGYLAQLGDPQGFQTIVRCFEIDIPAIRMLACKQLFFFVPFQGTQDSDGKVLDVYGLFERTLNDPDINIQWQTLAQLRELRAQPVKQILEGYIENAGDEQLRNIAREILGRIEDK